VLGYYLLSSHVAWLAFDRITRPTLVSETHLKFIVEGGIKTKNYFLVTTVDSWGTNRGLQLEIIICQIVTAWP
jgi:hypothetical protein